MKDRADRFLCRVLGHDMRTTGDGICGELKCQRCPHIKPAMVIPAPRQER